MLPLHFLLLAQPLLALPTSHQESALETSFRNVGRNPLGNEIYRACVHRGGQQLKQLNLSPGDDRTIQSQFLNESDLAKHDWHGPTRSPFLLSEDHDGAYTPVLDSLGMGGGKRYRDTIYEHFSNDRSDAEYRQIFAPQHGAIICSRSGPEPPEKKIPLHSWSEVGYLGWKIAAKDQPKLMKGLKTVAHMEISSISIEDTITRALLKTGGKKLQVPYPGKTFTLKDHEEQFKALLCTPEGSQTAALLAKHKHDDQLGWKTVESIQVFSSKDPHAPSAKFSLALHLTQANPSVSGHKRSYNSSGELYGRERSRHSYPRDDSEAPPAQSNSTTPSENQELTYEEAVAKGKEMHTLLDATSIEQVQSKWRSNTDSGAEGWVLSMPRPLKADIEKNVIPVMESLYGNLSEAHRNPPYNSMQWVANLTGQTDPKYVGAADTVYENFYDERLIFSICGAKEVLPAADKAPGQTPPELRTWSDVTFIQYNESFSDHVKDLRKVVKYEVDDKITLAIIHESTAKMGKANQSVSLEAGTEGYQAILGTPAGKDVVDLLAQHREPLGRKCVIGIDVWPSDERPSLEFTFKDDGDC